MLLTGPVTHRGARVLRNLYEQMPSPKAVVAVGTCACSGGVFHNCYNCLGGVDRVIPVDVYVLGVLPTEKALRLGVVGPTLRASGVAQDLRMTGYSAYGDLDFEPVVEQAGDCYARMVVRARECFQTIDLVRRALERLPDGDIQTKPRGNPNGRAIVRVEAPRGELMYFVVGNGTKNLERMRVRTPTLANLPAVLEMIPGAEFADVPVITLSIDPCISCTGR